MNSGTLSEIAFDRSFSERPGEVTQVSPLIRRVMANNAGPFTFTGTCTYIIGRAKVALIDPGPADPGHIGAILAAVRGETVQEIVVTHTHRDHSPAAAAIKSATGARIVGCAPYRPARSLAHGEVNLLEGANDIAYAPDVIMSDGETIAGPNFTLSAVATPGHTTNHVAFALAEEAALFSGDHVMAWSTSIVAPPDGAMADYLRSLEKILAREERIYWPGHGGPVGDPPRFVRALLQHRRMREAAILARVQAGDTRIETIVAQLYSGLDPRLTTAASLSVLAHLEDLVGRGLVAADGPPGLSADYHRGIARETQG